MLRDILPRKYRTIVKAIVLLVGLVLGATQVGYVAAAVAQPVWLTVAINVLAYVATAGMGLVRGETPSESHEDAI